MEELTTLERAIRLQRVDLFSDLETEMLALIASIARQIEVKQGEKLVEEGGPISALYTVLEGKIEMRRGASVIYSISSNETLGNWALFDRKPSVVSAIAATDTSLLAIDREEFFELLADHSEVTRELFQALFKRVRSLLSPGIGGPEEGSGTPR
jgi:CRP/FNR family cyclic AMP-dependent transcriptional regulator